MNAKKCDRCGIYYDLNNHCLTVKTKPAITIPEFVAIDWTEYDLCESCQQNFRNFINSYKKEG